MSKKISLHIGLNRVDPVHYQGWNGRLFCCENDAEFYYDIAKKSGFHSSTLLRTEEATSAALETFLRGAGQNLVACDFLFITYSGHGGFTPDLNSDEPDLQDETWCLYDREYIDDEQFTAFNKFSEGVKILIISDSCHSGTVSRAKPAFLELQMAAELNTMYTKLGLRSREAPIDKIAWTYGANKAIYDPILTATAVDPDAIPPFVMLFAACQDKQTALESGDHGLFTANMKKVLEGNTQFESYSSLFEKAKSGTPPVQTPNFFIYGNRAYDFTHELPCLFSTSKSDTATVETPVIVQESESDGLIVHEPGKGNRTEVVRAKATEAKAWDQAYAAFLSAPGKTGFIEPNINTRYLRQLTRAKANDNEYMPNWPTPVKTPPDPNEFIWHLDNEHSQLRMALKRLIDESRINNPPVRIGHIDTGYLPTHPAKPKNLLEDFGTSFVNGESGNKGIDKLDKGTIGEQDGHGAATLAILAGKYIAATDSYGNFAGEFGAIPFAEIVPIRICDTVFNMFNANDVADGIIYAVDHNCEVITMSMAGYPTRKVAKAVNYAYEKGVTVVTAAGNNWLKGAMKFLPKAVMYTARFERVIAATGACYNQEPYDFDANSWLRSRSEGGNFMQGNWGPVKAMRKAIAAYTPNVAWASMNDNYRFSKSGGGTSSSTPQIAAAAALWIEYNRANLKELKGTWRQVEAVRTALYRSADKSYPGSAKYFGNGILRAANALNAFDFKKDVDTLQMSAEAHVKFLGLLPFFGTWFRSKASGDEKNMLENEDLQEMISLEIAQLIYRDPALYPYVENIDFDNADDEYFSDENTRNVFKEKLKASVYASDFLKNIL